MLEVDWQLGTLYILSVTMEHTSSWISYGGSGWLIATADGKNNFSCRGRTAFLIANCAFPPIIER